jgi:hypothetical protein
MKPLWILAVALASASCIRARDFGSSQEAAKIIFQAEASGTAVQKKPIARVDQGPILFYRFRISGASSNYHWIIVPSEESKLFILGLLKSLDIIKEKETPWVKTLQESIDTMQGSNQESRAAKLRADMQNHFAIVESYEHDPARNTIRKMEYNALV